MVLTVKKVFFFKLSAVNLAFFIGTAFGDSSLKGLSAAGFSS
jgi:hypothetical protein